MHTNNRPVMWTYLSRRLLSLIWDQHCAASGKSTTDITMSANPLPGFGINVARKLSAGRDNWYWLADRVTEAVSDYTGTLDDPTGASYVRGTGILRWGQLPVGFLDDQDQFDPSEFEYTIAWLSGELRLRDGSRVFVAMGGTVSNYVGFDPGDGTGHFGWFPSSATGLSNIIRGFGKYRDATVEDQMRFASALPKHAYETRYCTSTDVVDDAYFMHHRLEDGWWVGEAKKEFLMQVLFEEQDYEIEGRLFRNAIVGTPLWVRDPEPRPFEKNSRHRSRRR